ncbi:MAG: type IV pilus assembly protein PilA [Lysobacterales bacterium]|jgi:type IV pilus assembly protein PilA
MKLQNSKSGFTLLEIIIVIIIVGVLSSLALPKLFSTVEYARSTEALNYLGSIRRGLDFCAQKTGATDFRNCGTLATSGVTAPDAPTSHFTYVVSTAAVTGPEAGTLTIVATRTTLDGGIVTDTITMSLVLGTNSVEVNTEGLGSFSQL